MAIYFHVLVFVLERWKVVDVDDVDDVDVAS
jgi:hypothetical protein